MCFNVFLNQQTFKNLYVQMTHEICNRYKKCIAAHQQFDHYSLLSHDESLETSDIEYLFNFLGNVQLKILQKPSKNSLLGINRV